MGRIGIDMSFNQLLSERAGIRLLRLGRNHSLESKHRLLGLCVRYNCNGLVLNVRFVLTIETCLDKALAANGDGGFRPIRRRTSA